MSKKTKQQWKDQFEAAKNVTFNPVVDHNISDGVFSNVPRDWPDFRAARTLLLEYSATIENPKTHKLSGGNGWSQFL